MKNVHNQLVMRRSDLDGLPEAAVPEGFALRHYRDGDEIEWNRIVDYCQDGFVQAIKDHRFFKPEKVKFICANDQPAATATAWDDDENDATLGVVHMVAADPDFRGKGLGLPVVAAVLHHMKREGKTHASLLTDNFRLPAIKIYLKLGFEPVIDNEEHRDRWAQVYQTLGYT